MINIIVAILLIVILLIKVFDVIVKYKESFKNIFKFDAKVVSNYKDIKKGLMYRRKRLKENQGMLFEFVEPRIASLWMKNTYIPLDAIFLDVNGKIVDLKEDLKPLNKTNITSDKPCKFALEVNKNTIKNKNIKVGDYIKINKIKKL